MEKIVKVVLLTLLVLEILAIITHMDALLGYVGNVFTALIPGFIMIVVMIWLIKSLFK